MIHRVWERPSRAGSIAGRGLTGLAQYQEKVVKPRNIHRMIGLCVAMFCGLAVAQQPVRIDSTGFTDPRIPVAVPLFVSPRLDAHFGVELSAVVAYDLDFTGLFLIVPSSKYPPGFTGFTSDVGKINFEQWRATPAEHIVYANVSTQGDSITAECRLFDVLVSRQVVGKRLHTRQQWARLIAHQFSDEVVRFLTGVAGVASSEICFSAGEQGKKEIYVADYDGASVKKVTDHGSISIKPKFSPDGTKIAYLSYKDNYPFLYIFDRRTGVSTSLSRRVGLNHAPAWHPNGKRLALCLSKDGNTEIYVKNADGSGERRLTNNRGSDTSPTYSPDGSQIAFVSDRGGSPQIYVMNADGSAIRRLSYQGGSSYDPAWSPNGRSIGYVVDRSGAGLEVYVMSADGSNPVRLSDSVGGNESPSWSPDSRHIIFTSQRSGSPQLHVVTVETGIVRRVPGLEGLNCEGPNWGPRRK